MSNKNRHLVGLYVTGRLNVLKNFEDVSDNDGSVSTIHTKDLDSSPTWLTTFSKVARGRKGRALIVEAAVRPNWCEPCTLIGGNDKSA